MIGQKRRLKYFKETSTKDLEGIIESKNTLEEDKREARRELKKRGHTSRGAVFRGF